MNDAAILMDAAQRLSAAEGARCTAGRLMNLAAFLLSADGVPQQELYMRLQTAFLGFDVNDLGNDVKKFSSISGGGHA